jgi:two-component system sensor histidine kinase YesM
MTLDILQNALKNNMELNLKTTGSSMVKRNRTWFKEPKYIERRIELLFTFLVILIMFTLFLVFLFYYGHIENSYWFFIPFLLIFPLLYYGYNNVYKPYKHFSHLLQLFNSGHTYSHFTDLENPFSKEFEEMDNRLSQILNSNDLMSASKRQAQYLALQNQINPHFLYNTLEGIRSEALIEGNTSISSMSEALSTFFRYTISHVENLVSLSDEIDNTNNYFFIQEYRFGDRLSLKVLFLDDCREDSLRIKIPKLTLQPIVENAIIHGLETKGGNGEVIINIELLDTRLLITVKDNGIGMDEDELNSLRNKLSTNSANQFVDESKGNGGIALINVDQRIKILFGEQYGLDITSCKGLGTDITISLPIEYTSKGNEY